MSDGCTDAQRMCDSYKKIGGPAYCEKCGKYHPVLPFCPDARVPDVKSRHSPNADIFLKQMRFIMEHMDVELDPDFQRTVNEKFWELV